MEVVEVKIKNKFILVFVISAFCFFFNGGLVAKEQVNNVRIWLAPENTRMVFDLSGAVSHKVFTLSNPDRVVIDIDDTELNTELASLAIANSPIIKVRSSGGKPLRVVLDLKEPLKPSSFKLKPNDDYGHRLVVDLERLSPKASTSAVKKDNSESASNQKTVEENTSPRVKPTAHKTTNIPKGKKLRDIVIALDAGHGGEDPGAIGPSGLKEKVVVLSIAKELEKLIDAESF